MLRACILAAIAGYTDTVGYLRFDAFAGLMTGNTVFLGIALSNGSLEQALHFGAIILSFFVGVLVARTLLRFHCVPAAVLSLSSVMLVVCAFYEAAGGALILAFAMGTENAAATRFGKVTLNTVFITGNLQKFGEGLVGRLWPGQGRHAEAPPGVVAIFGLVWLSYAVGAALGAAGHMLVPRPLLVPAVVLPFVLLRGKSQKPAVP
jgi:uncharacterized membrane protein YoaK (UPF0700 family)